MFQYAGRGSVFLWRQGDVPTAPPDPGPGGPDTVPPGSFRPQRRFEIRHRGTRVLAFTAWRPGAATPAQSYSFVASGGIVFSGVSPASRSATVDVGGGFTFGGVADVSTTPLPVPNPEPEAPEVVPLAGMLRDKAADIIAARLGFRTDLRETIIFEMQTVQAEELEQDNEFKPWFLFRDISTLETNPNRDWIDLPADFLLQVDDIWLYYNEPDVDPEENPWKPIMGNVMSEAIGWQIGTTESRPRIASIQGTRVYVRPTPTQALPLRLVYFAREPALTTNITNNWLRYASDWLISATAAKIARLYLQDDKAGMLQEAEALKARKRLWLKTETRLNTGMDFIKGGED